MPTDVLLIALSLVAAAFFAGAETAFSAASRARLQALETAGDPRAALVNRLLQRQSRLISAMLMGGQFVTIGSSAIATGLFLASFGDRGVVYATAMMTALVIVFAEVLPKTLAIAYPERASLALAPTVGMCVAILSPVVAAVEWFVSLLLRFDGHAPQAPAGDITGAEELLGAVDILHREGGVAREERDMLGGLLELGEIPVSDIMIHRTKMRTLDADLPPTELVKELLTSPYTRVPIWRGEPDEIVGVLHVRDYLKALVATGGDPARVDVSAIASAPWYIPESTSLRDQLRAFLARKTHSALVVDEYGVVQGLVTLEDIIEEIVGDIHDEHDEIVQGVRKQRDGSLIVEGSVTIRDLNRAMNWKLPDEEAATIAGLVIHEVRAIPETRQTFSFHGLRFEVLRKQRNRIAALRIEPLTTKASAEAKVKEPQLPSGDAAPI